MPTYPRLTNRYEGSVELVIHSNPDVRSYQFGAANTLDTAFAGVTAMFDVPRDGTYRSRGLKQRGLGTSLYTSRGLTVAMYNPEEFWTGGGTLPHDFETAYVRITETSAAGVVRPAGPILIVPPPGFFTTTRPSLTVSGTAPNVAASTTGNPPAGAMHFVLPRFADSTTITNDSGNPLLVSFGAGMPEFQVLDGQTTLLPDGAVSELYLRGSGGTAAFTIFFAIVNAEMA